jgi:hypothetical protein
MIKKVRNDTQQFDNMVLPIMVLYPDLDRANNQCN